MRKMMFLLAVLLLPASWCSAQLLITQDPRATSYMLFVGQPPRAVISPLTSDESAKFKSVYDAALASNHTLEAGIDALQAQVDAYRNTLCTAMVKVHPEIQPFLQAASQNPLTTDHRDEILRAQAEAMRADPKLKADWDDLSKKMMANLQAVNAAMLKLDPSVAPILAKFSP